MIIRNAVESEMREIAWIHESIPALWTPEFVLNEDRVARQTELFRSLLTKEDSALLVAVLGGQIVGFHWIDVEDSLGHIKSLWVHDSHRGNGIARELKQRGEAWSLSRKAKGMKTYVYSTNQQMMEFNLRRGFKPTWISLEKPFPLEVS